MTAYQIHDNGGRSYQVVVNGTRLDIYRQTMGGFSNEPCLTAQSPQIWIGRSPRTEQTIYSGGWGPAFDGNTVLYQDAADTTYTHIGAQVRRFRTLSPIVEFVSPIGNNDVPYPYAVDEQGNTYLIIESVILKAINGQRAWVDYDDPYTYYYRANLITADMGTIPPTQPLRNFRGITAWWVGSDRFTMRYTPRPDAAYDTRMSAGPPSQQMYIQCVSTRVLPKEEYVEIHRAFGELSGFRPLECRKVCMGHG